MWNIKWKSLLLDPQPILPMVAHLRYITEPHCIISPWVSRVSPLLWAKASTPFILDYLYKGICIANILEDKDNVSLWGRGWICFLSRQPLGQRLNRFASASPDRTGYFPKLRFLSWDTHCADLRCMSHLPLRCPLATRETSVNMQLTLSAVLWIIKSFVSDPVVLCLLPASTKLFVYMEGKLSGPSHFLAYPHLPFVQVRLKWYAPALPTDEVSGFHHTVQLEIGAHYPLGYSKPS